MRNTSESFRDLGSCRVLASIVILLLGVRLAGADEPKVVVLKAGDGVVPIGDHELKNTTNRKSSFAYSAQFKFHPEDTVTATAEKTIQNFNKAGEALGVNPPSATLNYLLSEDHGTTGNVAFAFTLKRVPKTDPKTKVVRQALEFAGTATPTIKPGKTEPPKNVSINAAVNDPMSFSDTDPNALFGAMPDGVSQFLSLGAGTSLANTYSPDGVAPGALASGTQLAINGRARLGVFANGSDFWTPSTGTDLYTLTLQPDPVTFAVTAHLTFVAPNSDFALTYYDHLGNVFDPTNATDVDAIETYVENAFTGGTLGSDLNDILAVSVVPTGGADFTLGQGDTASIAAVETAVPEPASLLALTAGGMAFLARRRKAI